MYIKVTKKLANKLNESLKCDHVSKPARFEYMEVSPDYYDKVINFDLFKAYDYGDYNWEKGVFKCIAAIYPGEYFAMNQYITTYDLVTLFNEVKHDGIEFDEFANRVIESVSI